MGKEIDLHCRAFQSAIEVLGSRWNGLILGLLQGGPMRFSEIEESSRGLGPKTLSARLKSLERKGIVERRIEAGPPVRVQYSLTARGRAFEHVAEAIERWGQELVFEEAVPTPHGEKPRRRKRVA